jgi:hypothetical protein
MIPLADAAQRSRSSELRWTKIPCFPSTFQRLYQTVDDPNDVVILLDMADFGKAKAFANSEDLKAAMQRAGVIDAPTLHLLEGPIV